MALEDEAIRAVVTLHDDLTAWMGLGDRAAWDRVTAALATDFVQVTPAGALRSRAQVVEAVGAVGGAAGGDFAIRVTDASARRVGDGVVVTYKELQSGSPRAARDRISTALLLPSVEGRLEWRHLHETWCD